MHKSIHGKILTIAGSDPSGGAGIQADIKTIAALGGYAMAAITCLTVQNSLKVYDSHPVAAEIVSAQVRAVMEDMPPDVIKLGMLGTAEIVESLAALLRQFPPVPLVVDPVILSTSGHELLSPRGIDIMKQDVFPLTTLLTPNLGEAAKLLDGPEITTVAEMKQAGEKLRALGPESVLIKGGHLSADILTDVLVCSEGVFEYSSPAIETRHTHGTGCTLASAVATGLAQGKGVLTGVEQAREYVQKAISAAPGFGAGNGPLNHSVFLD